MMNALESPTPAKKESHAMSEAGPLRLMMRTATDAFIGLVLFLTFVLAVGAIERNSAATHRLGGLLAVSSSAGDFLKFTLDDNPLIAAAVVATAVPVPQAASFTAPPRAITNGFAMLLLGGIVSAMVAFNLAFFRHLRREYASPR
ncbi:MAG: hypothetical protein WC829_08450 [Hyphomicrobium sp.]